ncbi:unnamed protein product [Rhizoctonia solani]|uniref:Xyloglucan-specific endo-beta-1,4-glucanase A n=1 Tax=Rhizoctonia solani TaxID=456999 RepID=A0A8H3CH64_9AGAM|nr:unnamed protein product [Rhizoctonia solani]
MAKFTLAATFFVLSTMVSAIPTLGVRHHTEGDKANTHPAGTSTPHTVLTEQWASESIGNGQYTLYNNLWGAKVPGTSGSQTTQALSYNDAQKTVSWKTEYNWQGNPHGVKSYANVALEKGIRKNINSISSIPTKWSWKYDSVSNPLTADVSYDLWLSRDPNSGPSSASSTVEVMVWLSNRNAGPAGSKIATAKVGGLDWALFKGRVGTWDVYSFVAASEISNYNANLLPFFTFLRDDPQIKLDLNQYLVAVQAGTEPFQGSATLTTEAYSVAIN